MKPKLFITDLDGTLFTDDKVISRQDLDTLTRLREKGIVTAIATGRSVYSFKRAMDLINLNGTGLPVDYLIFSTGAGILSLVDDTVLLKHDILPPDITKITSYFEGAGLDYMVHKAIPDTPYFLYKSHGSDNPDFQRRINLYPDFATPMNSHTPMFESATQVLAIVPGGMPDSKVDRIRLDLSDYSVVHATSPLDHTSSWIEVFNKKVSKSLSAAWLAAQLNISRDEVVSVGNDYNDRDLLEWSGNAFFVANGAKALKSFFRATASNNDSGVSRAASLSGLL